jgi:hypothetical protein
MPVPETSKSVQLAPLDLDKHGQEFIPTPDDPEFEAALARGEAN